MFQDLIAKGFLTPFSKLDGGGKLGFQIYISGGRASLLDGKVVVSGSLVVVR